MMSEREIKQYATEGHPPQIVLLIDKILDKKLDEITERVNKLYAAYVVVIKKQQEIENMIYR